MLNVIPILRNSLENTESKVCYRGWVKEQFIDSFKSLWATSSCKQHEQDMNVQIDKFNYELHVDLASIASMLQSEVGLIGSYFFNRVKFAQKDNHLLYHSWTLIGQSYSPVDCSIVDYQLYECPYNPEIMAVVFKTTVGLIGFAEWNYDYLEIWSEELHSEKTLYGDKYDESIAELLAQNCHF